MNYGEIRDPIHGNIEFNETEAKIINTPEMQRLRYIKQLDTAYFVFPGANHTRFEHSLGTMQVTKELVRSVYKNDSREFAYVGLLHDIGHGPFSHLSEEIIKTHLKKNHEQIGEDVIRNSEIKDIINDSGMSVDKIISYFKSDKMDIVGGALGSDRIDYLMRDSHYTGVAYGVIDYDRIKGRLTLFDNKVAITESGISGAESMLIARYFMHSNVYTHHTKTISAKMLQSAILFCLENGAFDATELAAMNDEQLMERLLNSEVAKSVELAKRIRERRLFKRAYYKDINSEINIQELASDIEKAGFGMDQFVVHVRSLAGGKDNIDVVNTEGEKIGNLAEMSPLIKALSGMLTNSRKLIVACDKDNIEKIGAIVRKSVE